MLLFVSGLQIPSCCCLGCIQVSNWSMKNNNQSTGVSYPKVARLHDTLNLENYFKSKLNVCSGSDFIRYRQCYNAAPEDSFFRSLSVANSALWAPFK